MQHSSLAIANEFIKRGLEEGARKLTHMQVQKLIYLAHGWHLGAFGEALIEDQVEAWKFGPVVRKLYAALSRYGSGPITKPIQWGADTILFGGDDGEEAYEELSPSEVSVLDLVWNTYSKYPAFRLSALTHEDGSPWEKTYSPGENRVIPNPIIEQHFKQLIAAD